MIQYLDKGQDVEEREEGGWVGLQSSWLEAKGDKDKAHSVIWASAHTKMSFLSFFPLNIPPVKYRRLWAGKSDRSEVNS